MLHALHQLAVNYTYSPSGTYSLDAPSSGHRAFSAIVILLGLLFVIALLVISIIAMWRVFTKAGKPGWAATIPIYSTWVLAEIAGRPGWQGLAVALLPIIPFVGAVASFVLIVLISIDVARRFGRSATFGVVGLVIFSLIGYLILGFGKDEYHPDAGADSPVAAGGAGTDTAVPQQPMAAQAPAFPAREETTVPPSAPVEGVAAEHDGNSGQPGAPTVG